jgi:hypothetical protein
MSFLAVAHAGRGSPDPRRCRPQGSCPSRRFELVRGSRRDPPDASRPCSMPLASLELPSRAFSPRGAAPALTGRCFLAGSSSDHRPAQRPRDRRDRFHRSRQLFASCPPRGGPGTQEPGRRIPAATHPKTLGSPENGRHARFEALLPPRVRSATTPSLGQAGPSVGALLGFCPSRALSSSVPGPVSRRGTRAKAKPSRALLQAPSHRGCTPRSGLRPRAREPRIRRSARFYRPLDHRRAATQLNRRS